MQSDQEPSIIDVKHKAGTHIPTEIVYDESLVGNCHANGSIERANQTIQGQIRATKDCTERQICATIGLDSSVLKWLVRHAAWTLTIFLFGSDGKAAHQRIRDKPFNQQIVAFGEPILFKPRKPTGPQQKLAVNWMDGCLLGFNTRTGQHIVSNKAAVADMPQHSETKQRRTLESRSAVGNSRKSLEFAGWTRGSRSRPCCTGQISSDGEPRGSRRTDSDENQERRERQTHLHHEEDGVCVWSDVGQQGLLGDRTTSLGGMPSQDYRTDGERSCQNDCETPQESADTGGASVSSAGVDVDMRVIHAGKRTLDPGGDRRGVRIGRMRRARRKQFLRHVRERS